MNREGRDCARSRRATRRMLFARGRPRSWLLLLLAACAFVLVRAVAWRIQAN